MKKLIALLLALSCLFTAVSALAAPPTGEVPSKSTKIMTKDLDWTTGMLTIAGALTVMDYSLAIENDDEQKDFFLTVAAKTSYCLENDKGFVVILEYSSSLSYVIRYTFGDENLNVSTEDASAASVFTKIKGEANYPNTYEIPSNELTAAMKLILEKLNSK